MQPFKLFPIASLCLMFLGCWLVNSQKLSTSIFRLKPNSVSSNQRRWQLIGQRTLTSSKPDRNRWSQFTRRFGSLQSALQTMLPMAQFIQGSPVKRPSVNNKNIHTNIHKKRNPILSISRRTKIKPSKVNSMEARQLGLIRTLFRYPFLLIFSNLFRLPLLPMLLLASGSPLNGLPSSSASSSALSSSSSSSSALGSSPPLSLASLANSNAQVTMAQLGQLGQMFSVNSSSLFGSFITDLITEIQAGSNLVNDFLQTMGNAIVKPNRVGISNGNFAANNLPQRHHNQMVGEEARRPPYSVSSSNGFHSNSTLTTFVNGTEVIISNLPSNDSNTGYSFSSSSSSSSSSPNDVSFDNFSSNNANTAGSSLLNQLANSLVESSKNHQITEALSVEKAQIGNAAHDLLQKFNSPFRLRQKRTQSPLSSSTLSALVRMMFDRLTDPQAVSQQVHIFNLFRRLAISRSGCSSIVWCRLLSNPEMIQNAASIARLLATQLRKNVDQTKVGGWSPRASYQLVPSGLDQRRWQQLQMAAEQLRQLLLDQFRRSSHLLPRPFSWPSVRPGSYSLKPSDQRPATPRLQRSLLLKSIQTLPGWSSSATAVINRTLIG